MRRHEIVEKRNETPYQKALLKFINDGVMESEEVRKVAQKFGKTESQVRKDFEKLDTKLFMDFG